MNEPHLTVFITAEWKAFKVKSTKIKSQIISLRVKLSYISSIERYYYMLKE